jgi:Trk-type K+ transport system membrane component
VTLHALFESMSGWTGSGLTMAVHGPSLPRAIQWWRSLIQWVRGVGVIVSARLDSHPSGQRELRAVPQ